MKIKANKTQVVFGEKTNKEVAEFEFILEGDIDKHLHYIHFDCSCTTGTFDNETGVIKGRVNLAQVGVNSGVAPITKYIKVFLDKDIPYFSATEGYMRQVTPNKGIINLTVTGMVTAV